MDGPPFVQLFPSFLCNSRTWGCLRDVRGKTSFSKAALLAVSSAELFLVASKELPCDGRSHVLRRSQQTFPNVCTARSVCRVSAGGVLLVLGLQGVSEPERGQAFMSSCGPTAGPPVLFGYGSLVTIDDCKTMCLFPSVIRDDPSSNGPSAFCNGTSRSGLTSVC